MREQAGQDRSAPAAAPELHHSEPSRPGLLREVTELGWLSPRASSLVALGQPCSTAVWSALRDDPGAVLLLLRLPSATACHDQRTTSILSLLDDPALPADALRHLTETNAGFVNWAEPALAPIYRAALTYAHLSEQLAIATGQDDADKAWICGLLVPLAWFAVCAVAPAKALACLAEPNLSHDAVETQLRHWGAEHAALGRRLARRWKLPGWLTAIVGHLGLPEAQARTFGAEPALLHLTRLAITLARGQVVELGLGKAEWAADSAAYFNLSYDAVETLVAPARAANFVSPTAWEAPHSQPLLREVLRLAADNRRLRGVQVQEQLESDLDELQRAFEEQVHGEAQRLQAAKLAALAEFAGGAGHEINNPLAVISGQAQYLLNHERDWLSGDTEGKGKATKALHTIIGQTKRVHSLLRDLMLFARPSSPRKAWFDLPTLLGEVAAGLEEFAAQRLVRLEIGSAPEKLPLLADAEQVRIALTCLLKNAIEAAPPEGWARLRVIEPVGEPRVEIAVEDSGVGPLPEQREHLFDPFYCGRAAGRGRGLGLPIAWRLLRQQSGDIRLAPQAHGPTCFLVTLPRINVPPVEATSPVRNGTAVEY